ncbi:hypothetical protein [Bartonella tribocorum]|uniref:Uncharacterized protein n=1 Tax=Bartonella tribocorum (strain DSM 28219 / CCUG 45778 / CIP 105476 / IBS 506) TaxID=382640 RepID=A9IXW3_BART1|nr:hypothetical protein [Bartonella tribocorum]CAK02250.1 hypothetical protein BT_2121a [Bartonella tribocorum CIP 105476]CDO49549.1 hypothetical protein BM1374166_01905 [Bartonella tribocorum]
MPSYLKTSYQGFPLYYAGKTRNLIRLEPQKHNAVLFISQEMAEMMAKNLAEEYCCYDFFIVQ